MTPSTPTIPSGASTTVDRGTPSTVKTRGLTAFELKLHALFNKLFKRRDIVIENELYLRRWFLTPRSWPIRIFLHCILRPDEQRALHDHPWSFVSFIIARGYREVFYATKVLLQQVVDGRMQNITASDISSRRATRVAKPFSITRLPAEHTHAVDPFRGPAWTLVFAGPSRRMWGFHTPASEQWSGVKVPSWRPWREYLGLAPSTPEPPEDTRK